MNRQTDNNTGANDPAEFERLTEAERRCLLLWIELAMQPAKTCKAAGDSYGQKHSFEYIGGFYVTNGAFKGAMRAAGYEPVEATALNWKFLVKPRRRRLGDKYASHLRHGYGLDQLTPDQRAEYLQARKAVGYGFSEAPYYSWLGEHPSDDDERWGW